MKRILIASAALIVSAAHAETQRIEENITSTIGPAPPAQHVTVQDSPLSPVILKRVAPGSDEDEVWGLSAPPGISLTADLTAKVHEIAVKEQQIKAVRAQMAAASGGGEELQLAQDACRLSADAGAAYHAAFKKFHATVAKAGTGEFRAYPEQGALDTASRRYTRAITGCLQAAHVVSVKPTYICEYSVCIQVPEAPARAMVAEKEVLPCSAVNHDPVCQVSP